MRDWAQATSKRFKVIGFDWDGTAVEDRRSDARPAAHLLNGLMEIGVQIVVITGTNFDNIDRQFCRLIQGPQKRNLYVGANRGSEIFGFDGTIEPLSVWRYEATPQQEKRLTRVAEGVREYVRSRGHLEVGIVYDRFNRRKIDLIPLPEWAEPSKSQTDELLAATEERLRSGGITGGIEELLMVAVRLCREHGIEEPRITSDVKHIEVGLTDKAETAKWIGTALAPRVGAEMSEILIVGDEFGSIGDFPGSDSKMVISALDGAVFLSVGRADNNRIPSAVIHVGGGPPQFLELLRNQIALKR